MDNIIKEKTKSTHSFLRDTKPNQPRERARKQNEQQRPGI